LRNFRKILRINPRLGFWKEHNLVLKICKYNKITFLTKPHKIVPFSQKATKTALAVCSLLITSLQELISVISGFYACRLAPKPGTK